MGRRRCHEAPQARPGGGPAAPARARILSTGAVWCQLARGLAGDRAAWARRRAGDQGLIAALLQRGGFKAAQGPQGPAVAYDPSTSALPMPSSRIPNGLQRLLTDLRKTRSATRNPAAAPRARPRRCSPVAEGMPGWSSSRPVGVDSGSRAERSPRRRARGRYRGLHGRTSSHGLGSYLQTANGPSGIGGVPAQRASSAGSSSPNLR